MPDLANKIAVLACAAAVWLAFRLGLYHAWSRAYRLLFERRYRARPPVPSFPDLRALELTLGRMRWCRDAWPELGDAIGSAKAAYYRHVDGAAIGDCDEFAVLAADRIDDLRRMGGLPALELLEGEIGVLSVPWMDGWRAGGHNVCAFSYYDDRRHVMARRWAHVGNWHAGATQWGFLSIAEIVRSVCGPRSPLGWAFADAGTLAVLRVGWRAR